MITIVGVYAIPDNVFINPDHSIYSTGLVDHKSISESYHNNEFIERYTISVKLFEDDLINGVKNGETAAYLINHDDWLIIEWGDTVNLNLKSDFKADLIEVFPALKLPEWHAISGSASPLSIKVNADKTIYNLDENPIFNVTIENDPQLKGWTGSTIPISITLLEEPMLYVFKDGEILFRSSSALLANETVFEPNVKNYQTMELDLNDLDGNNFSEGIYYVRIYLGYFTENKQITLACTTLFEIVKV